MNRGGFTLVELMIVVAVIGILAAVAIPSYQKMLVQAKAAEMPVMLKSMSTGAIAWFQVEHTDTDGNPMPQHFPNSKSPTAYATSADNTTWPSYGPCPNNEYMYKKNSQNWEREPFKSLNFSINKAHYFRYGFYTDGTNKDAYFWARAISDFDCDGNKALFQISGHVEDENLEVVVHNLFRTYIAAGYNDFVGEPTVQ